MDKKNQDYLFLSRAKEIKEPKKRILYRFFEMLPGILSWATLLGALIFSWIAPRVVAFFIILFDLYWLLRIVYLSWHQISSFREMKKNLSIDWTKKLNEIENWERLYHLIILPMYKEGREIVEGSLQSVLECPYPKDRMIIILALEERAGQEVQKLGEELKSEFSDKFFQFLVTVHPKDIPGEIKGKGSNVSWALQRAKEKIVRPLKLRAEDILVSSFDIDTKPYPQYFSCLAFHYLTAEKPLRSSYQPIPVYNNNIWSAPSFSRVVATSNTFWQMMQQERPEVLVTYSSHSLPFKVIEDVGYPNNVVPDDSRVFWRAYFYYDGDYRVVPLHYPVSMDAVLAKNLSRTVINQYRQQRRWAWGCVDIPFVLFGFLKNKKVSIMEKIYHVGNILEGFWSWSTVSLLIFFLGWLPLLLGGDRFNVTLLSYNLPRITRNLMTLSMVGVFVSATVSLLLLPPKPKGAGRFKNLSLFLQWLLLPITLILFGSIPSLDAQTRLLMGKYLGFWVTEKTRSDNY